MWGLGGVVVLGDLGLNGLALGFKINSLALGFNFELVTVDILSGSSCALLTSGTGLIVMAGVF